MYTNFENSSKSGVKKMHLSVSAGCALEESEEVFIFGLSGD